MVKQFMIRALKIIIMILVPSLMSGCILLMLTGPSQLAPKQTQPLKLKQYQVQAYTMRGFLDVFSTGMNSLAKKIQTQLKIQATALSYLEEKKLATFLIQNYQSGRFRGPIILIGHSYGADEQITVARLLNDAHVPVDLLISLDNTKKQTIPPNVRVFYNINSGRSVMSWLVPWGTPLIASSGKTKMVEINLVKDKHLTRVNHFNIDKLPEVQAYVIEVIQENLKTR